MTTGRDAPLFQERAKVCWIGSSNHKQMPDWPTALRNAREGKEIRRAKPLKVCRCLLPSIVVPAASDHTRHLSLSSVTLPRKLAHPLAT